jgi:hypothetical protein
METLMIDKGERKKMALPHNGTRRGGELFASKEELGNVVVEWPGKRLVEFWNEIPGVKPVRKFTDRKTAINRIWNALQESRSHESVSRARPESADQPKAFRKSERDRRMTQRTRSKQARSKKDAILKLLRKPAGVTLEKLMRVTGWQAHSVRGFISAGVNKRMGFRVTSNRREDGQRVYQIADRLITR